MNFPKCSMIFYLYSDCSGRNFSHGIFWIVPLVITIVLLVQFSWPKIFKMFYL